MKIETLGDFRQITENLTDDFKVDLRVRRRLTNEEVKEKSEITWPYPYHTDYVTLQLDKLALFLV